MAFMVQDIITLAIKKALFVQMFDRSKYALEELVDSQVVESELKLFV